MPCAVGIALADPAVRCSLWQILIDGMDLITFDPQWLRDQIGLVSQVPFPLRDGATVHCKQTQTVRLCS